MLTKILVPLDGSPFGAFAIDLALQVAKQARASLMLVHIQEPFVMAAGVPMVDTRLDLENRQVALTTVARLHERARVKSGQQCPLEVMEGDVAETLRRYVEEAHVDLVVMTTRGRSGFRRAVFGSVATALVHTLDIPILFARSSTEPSEIEPSEAEPTGSIKRILVPLDGSWIAEKVISELDGLTGSESTEYLLLRVLTPLPGPTEATIATFTIGREDVAPRKAEAWNYLSGVADRLRATGAAATPIVTVNASAARTILGAARKHKADMIAMSTHGAGMFERIILGSVADKIIRTASVPVFVYRPRHGNANITTGSDSIVAQRGPLTAIDR